MSHRFGDHHDAARVVRDGNRERMRETPRWSPAQVAWGAVRDGEVVLRDGYTVEAAHTVRGPLVDGCCVAIIEISNEYLVISVDEEEA